MKKKLCFYLVIICLVILQSLLVFFINKPVKYDLTIINLNNYTNKYLLAPKSIDFRPINTNQLKEKYQNTVYNFYYYLDPDYLVINGHEICLRIDEALID